jgi:hypothetical protein
LAAITIGIVLLIRWWTTPYVLTGTYPNGVRAWEQWERRTVSGKIEHLATVRYYTSGQKSFEYRDGMKTYWSPAGVPIDVEEWPQHFWEDSPEVVEQDSHSRRPWPFQ